MESVSAPDYYGPPTRAWRTWFVVPVNKTSGELRLRSFVYGDIWEQGEPHEAKCKYGFAKHHDAPDSTHKCGIYAVSSREQLDSYYRNGDYSAGSWMEIWRVIGEVGLWGKIVPGDKGYRAQYAYPLRLQVPKIIRGRDRHLTADEVAASLDHYGCEVEVVDESLDLRKNR